jgi:hypothetical protein
VRRAWLAAACLAGALLAPATPRAETPASDPAAVAMADRVMNALGGREKWDALPGLRWSFGSAVNDTVRSTRRHAWNKHTGWHRVEGKNRQGAPFCIIHNVNDGRGMAWMDGNPIEGDSLRKLIAFGKSLWTNDTYWFLMPYKLRDPGVVLRDQGEVARDGRVLHAIALSFEQVGETPGDRYMVFVDPSTSRVVSWEYVLQGNQPPASAWTWEGWQERDGLWFATAHMSPDRTRNVFTRDVEAVRAFGPAEFTAP